MIYKILHSKMNTNSTKHGGELMLSGWINSSCCKIPSIMNNISAKY